MLIGMGKPNLTISLSSAAFREIDLLGVFRYQNTYPRAIEILEGNEITGLGKLITHKYDGLDFGAEALEMAARFKDDKGNLIVKVLLRTSGEDILAKSGE